MLTIFHYGVYEEKFDDLYFAVGAGDTVIELDDTQEVFLELALSVDLRHINALSYAIEFINKFMSETVSLDQLTFKRVYSEDGKYYIRCSTVRIINNY